MNSVGNLKSMKSKVSNFMHKQLALVCTGFVEHLQAKLFVSLCLMVGLGGRTC